MTDCKHPDGTTHPVARPAQPHPDKVGLLRIAWDVATGPRAVRGRGQVLFHGWFDSPFGPMLVLGDARDIVGIAFCGNRSRTDVLASMRTHWPLAEFREDRGALADRARTLCESGEARIRLTGTERQHQVWAELLAIPKGETRSYRDIACRLGTPKGTRWVGQANGANPVAWLVPCHRVIGHDGRIAGYGWGTDVKRAMLEREGVQPLPA